MPGWSLAVLGKSHKSCFIPQWVMVRVGELRTATGRDRRAGFQPAVRSRVTSVPTRSSLVC